MPRLVELRRRFSSLASPDSQPGADVCEESLVCDPRNGMTPKQFVDRKLGRALLRESPTFESVAMFFRTKPR